MSDVNSRALELLDLAVVPGISPPVYAVGMAASRITMADQQRRSVNLIWALLREARVRPGEEIAIIGGGVAGVTAAAYALKQNVRVTVFEKFGDPFAIQQGSSRWLHPAIYDWPMDGWSLTATQLPCMNWSAGAARDVVAALRSEWQTILRNPLLTWKPGTEIVALGGERDAALLVDVSSNRHGPYACVVMAAGFGEEAPHPDFDCKPYWRDDDLHQRLRHGGVAFVSGCGDGGLTDAIRIALVDFRHDWLALVASKASADNAFVNELLRVERNSPAFPDGKALTDAILALPAPDAVTDLIRERLRPNTSVTLNASLDGPFSRTACLLNRFVVAVLMKLGAITYLRGTVALASINRDGSRFTIPIDGTTHLADLVVVRHGPGIRPLASFPAIDQALEPVRRFLRTYRAGVDRTRARTWGPLREPSSTDSAFLPPASTGAMDYIGTALRNAIKDELTRKGVDGAVVGYTRLERTLTVSIRVDDREASIDVKVGAKGATISHDNGSDSSFIALSAEPMTNAATAAHELAAAMPDALLRIAEVYE